MEVSVSGELNLDAQNSKKTRLKTPSQVKALEELYREENYPAEWTRMEIAERIGLTEKQVSRWFCRRRCKDNTKGEAFQNGRLDRLSGVVPDHESGQRQDSCGSTKQGDYGLVEHREVESHGFSGEASLPAGLAYEQKRHYAGGSSSTEAPRYLTQQHVRSTMPQHTEIVRSREFIGPSGYLKVMGDAAIAVVRGRLGGHYQEDGPLLGVEFQALPPGAFGSLILDPSNEELYNVGNPIFHPSNVSGSPIQYNLCKRYEGITSNMCFTDCYRDGSEIKMDGPEYWDDYLGHQSTKMYYVSGHRNLIPGRNYSADMKGDPTRKVPNYSSSCDYMIGSKRGPEEMSTPTNGLRRQHFDSIPSNSTIGHDKFVDMEMGDPSRRMPEGSKLNLYCERRAVKKGHDPDIVKLLSTVNFCGQLFGCYSSAWLFSILIHALVCF